MTNYATAFKGLSYINQERLAYNTTYSTIDWLNWCALGIGAFINVDVSLSGTYGGDRSRLRPVTDRRYADNTVYEGFRQNWVWETGIGFDTTPKYPSGVWIDSTYYDNEDATYGFSVDYPNGRLIFNNALNGDEIVQTTFSPRTVTITNANDPSVRFLIYDSYRIDYEQFLQSSSGNWGQWGDIRLQLPIIAVEDAGNTQFEPYELGSTKQWCPQRLTFYVFADNDYEASQYADMLRLQNDATVMLLDYSAIKSDANYPFGLNYSGCPIENPIMYPTIAASSTLQWSLAKLTNVQTQNLSPVRDKLYRKIVMGEMEMIVNM